MKSKITLLFVALLSISSFAQDKTYDLLKNKTQTNILYDRVYNLADATKIKNSEITTNYFFQVYHEMQRADFLNRLPELEKVQEQANIGFSKNQIPISVFITDFEKIKPEAFETNNVFFNLNKKFDITSTNVLQKHSINLIAPILAKSRNNLVSFVLKDNLIFNTTNRIVTSVEIQKNNNWETITKNQAFEILFSENGKQNVNTKINFENGETIFNSFIIEIDSDAITEKKSNNALPPVPIENFSSSIGYQGYGETAAFLGQGQYQIFFDTVDGVLDKPIFLLDGFDPGDTRNTTAIYQLLNYGVGQNMGDVVRAQGYDVIILNFPNYTRPNTATLIDGGVDYIQRNAMVLVELINIINAQKIGTAKNVVIGPSMGGLISRYALRFMEQNSLNHDTRLYISFDSPHLGANVPIGFQHLFNYMGFGPVGDVSMQGIVNGMLKSPASRQMLIDHFEGHLQAGSIFEFNTAAATLLPTGSPNYRNAFQTELNTMGFPLTTRNVSIANGAGNGTMTGTPDMVVMDHTFNTSTTQRAIINLRFTPLANLTNQVSRFRGQQNIFGLWITGFESSANSKSPTFTNGLDSAPGGRFDMSTLAVGSTNPTLIEFMNNLQIMHFDFIPTLSSMAISSSTNYYSNITAASTTPFVASSIPTVNENHITFNAENVAFALNEILNPVLNTNQNTILNSIWIKNPIENSIEINTNYVIENAKISIFDVIGKSIFEVKNQSIYGSLEIPVSLQKGIYFVTISDKNGNVTKKIIKE